MTDKQDEQQLIDQAKAALLEGIASSARRNSGESALAMAEAYTALTALTVKRDSEDAETARATVAREYRLGVLKGRR